MEVAGGLVQFGQLISPFGIAYWWPATGTVELDFPGPVLISYSLGSWDCVQLVPPF